MREPAPGDPHDVEVLAFTATIPAPTRRDPRREVGASLPPVSIRCSCGQRHHTGGRIAVEPFRGRHPLAETWCDPVTRTAGRGALSPTPLFYGLGPAGELRLGTSLPDVVAALGAPPSPLGVAARLTGFSLPVPHTPYRDVLCLPAGARLTMRHGRLRLLRDDGDWEGLLPSWSPHDRRRLVTEALGGALDDLPELARGCLGVSGGLGSAALAAVHDGGGPHRVHVRVGVPVLDARSDRLAAATELVDGTAAWHAVRDGDRPPFPEQCDPWVAVVAGRGGTCGRLLKAVFGPNVDQPRGWWRTGWAHLTAEAPPAGLAGHRWWRAFSPRRQPLALSSRTIQISARTNPTRFPAWLSDAARAQVELVRSVPGGSHLVPDCAGPQGPFRGALIPLLAALDGAGQGELTPAEDGTRHGTGVPAWVACHPTVVGAALRLRLSGRAGRGDASGAPALRELLPESWWPVDPPATGRDRLLAADLVTHRLAEPALRARLLEQAVEAGWADADGLATALSHPEARLRQSLWLHRLWATVAAYPEVRLERAVLDEPAPPREVSQA